MTLASCGRVLAGCVLLALPVATASQRGAAPQVDAAPPNIVLIFPDNIGVGEVGVYGGNRGVPTPRLDGLARAGVRLTNFNTEYFCMPSRAAILTGAMACARAPMACISSGRA